MIFVASQADASALNLGKISIKTIDDVSQDTYDVIAAYGNKSFTDDQIIAIDDFLLVFDKYKEKITCAILPIIGIEETYQVPATPSRLKCTYDLISKQYYGVRQQVGDSAVIKAGINGITSLGIPATGNDRAVLENSGLYLNNYTIITTGVLNDNRKFYINPITVSTIKENLISIMSINSISGSIQKNYNIPNDKILGFGYSIDVTNKDIKIYTPYNKEYIHDTSSIVVDNPAFTNIAGTGIRFGYNEEYRDTALSMYIVANTLTEEELKTLSDASYSLTKKLFSE